MPINSTGNSIQDIGNRIKALGYRSRRNPNGFEILDDEFPYYLSVDGNTFFLLRESGLYIQIALCESDTQISYELKQNKAKESIVKSYESDPGGNGFGRSFEVDSLQIIRKFCDALAVVNAEQAIQDKIIKTFIFRFDELLRVSDLEWQKRQWTQFEFDRAVTEMQVLIEENTSIDVSIFDANDELEEYRRLIVGSNDFAYRAKLSKSFLGKEMALLIDERNRLILRFC